jgi:hypothetical protein
MAEPITFVGPDGGTYRFTPTDPNAFPAAAPPELPPEQRPITGPDGGTYQFTPEGKGTPNYHGTVLPFSTDEEGESYFDPLNAGPGGIINRGVSYPKKIMEGEYISDSDEQLHDRQADTLALVTPFRTPVRRVPNRALKTPSLGELNDVYTPQYQHVRNLGIVLDAKPMSTFGHQMQAMLDVGSGFNKALAPKTYKGVRDLQRIPPGGDRDLSSIVAIRMQLGRVARSAKKSDDRAAATQVLIELDKFIDDLAKNPQYVRYGQQDVAEAIRVYRLANENYASAMPAADLAKALTKAERRAETSNSGMNVDNTIRQEARKIVDSGKVRLPPEQKAALEDVMKGTKGRNMMRRLGNRFGGGGGLGQMLTGALGTGLGIVGGGGLSAALILGSLGIGAGKLGRTVANKGTQRAFEEVEESLRKRSPVYKDREKELGATQKQHLSSLPPKMGLAAALGGGNIEDVDTGLPVEDIPEMTPEMTNLIQALIARQNGEPVTPEQMEDIIRQKYGDTDRYGRERTAVY